MSKPFILNSIKLGQFSKVSFIDFILELFSSSKLISTLVKVKISLNI